MATAAPPVAPTGGLLFIDSFAHYSTAQIFRKWNYQSVGSGATAPTISNTGNRWGGGYMTMTTTSAVNCCVGKNFEANIASWVVGFGFRISALPTSHVQIALLVDGVTTQCDLRLNSTGTLSVTRNGSALTGGTSVATLAANTWYFIEWKVTIADSIAAASCRVDVDEVTFLTVATSQDTKNTANAYAQILQLGHASGGTAGSKVLSYCDLYVLNGGTGTFNNDILGDRRVGVIVPTGVGSNSAWTPSAGNNWDNVEEIPADDDSSYVSTTADLAKDTYRFGTMPVGATGTISGLQTCVTARKTDAGSRTVCRVIRSGGENDGTPAAVLDEYFTRTQVSETDPATAAAWTPGGVIAAEFGARLTS